MDLRSKLEALLERDLQMQNVYKSSNTPLLSEGLDMFTIETPAKLKPNPQPVQRPQSCHPSRLVYPSTMQVPNPSSKIFYPSTQLANSKVSFGTIFSDPTPLRFISESPLVTPSRFHNY
jgi:hypothetical protein